MMAVDSGERDVECPERSCIVTRSRGTPDTMIRFALAPDGAVVPDIRARLPGRGAWVTATSTILAEAIRRKSFARAFKADAKATPELVGMVDLLLEKDALQTLSIANKAGLVVAGSTKIEAAVASRSLAALVHAREGGPDGRRKLDAAIKRQLGEAADRLPRIQIFRSDQLDLALGRTNVIHAALAAGAASSGFVARAQRLDRFRSGEPQTDTAGPASSIED